MDGIGWVLMRACMRRTFSTYWDVDMQRYGSWIGAGTCGTQYNTEYRVRHA